MEICVFIGHEDAKRKQKLLNTMCCTMCKSKKNWQQQKFGELSSCKFSTPFVFFGYGNKWNFDPLFTIYGRSR